MAGRILAFALAVLWVLPTWANEAEHYWFARAGVLAVDEPALDPLTVGALTYGYNVSRNTSFELDLMSSFGGGEVNDVDSSLSLNGAGGYVTKRLVVSNVAYLKAKLGGVMLDKRYSGALSDESETRVRGVPSLGAGALYHGRWLRRVIFEVEVSYLDTDAYMATGGLHLKF